MFKNQQAAEKLLKFHTGRVIGLESKCKTNGWSAQLAEHILDFNSKAMFPHVVQASLHPPSTAFQAAFFLPPIETRATLFETERGLCALSEKHQAAIKTKGRKRGLVSSCSRASNKPREKHAQKSRRALFPCAQQAQKSILSTQLEEKKEEKERERETCQRRASDVKQSISSAAPAVSCVALLFCKTGIPAETRRPCDRPSEHESNQINKGREGEGVVVVVGIGGGEGATAFPARTAG